MALVCPTGNAGQRPQPQKEGRVGPPLIWVMADRLWRYSPWQSGKRSPPWMIRVALPVARNLIKPVGDDEGPKIHPVDTERHRILRWGMHGVVNTHF